MFLARPDEDAAGERLGDERAGPFVEGRADRLAGDRDGPRGAPRGADARGAFEDVLGPGAGKVAASRNHDAVARGDRRQALAPACWSNHGPAGRRLREDGVELRKPALPVGGAGAVAEGQARHGTHAKLRRRPFRLSRHQRPLGVDAARGHTLEEAGHHRLVADVIGLGAPDVANRHEPGRRPARVRSRHDQRSPVRQNLTAAVEPGSGRRRNASVYMGDVAP